LPFLGDVTRGGQAAFSGGQPAGRSKLAQFGQQRGNPLPELRKLVPACGLFRPAAFSSGCYGSLPRHLAASGCICNAFLPREASGVPARLRLHKGPTVCARRRSVATLINLNARTTRVGRMERARTIASQRFLPTTDKKRATYK
jgi:hypothetical protein